MRQLAHAMASRVRVSGEQGEAKEVELGIVEGPDGPFLTFSASSREDNEQLKDYQQLISSIEKFHQVKEAEQYKLTIVISETFTVKLYLEKGDMETRTFMETLGNLFDIEQQKKKGKDKENMVPSKALQKASNPANSGMNGARQIGAIRPAPQRTYAPKGSLVNWQQFQTPPPSKWGSSGIAQGATLPKFAATRRGNELVSEDEYDTGPSSRFRMPENSQSLTPGNRGTVARAFYKPSPAPSYTTSKPSPSSPGPKSLLGSSTPSSSNTTGRYPTSSPGTHQGKLNLFNLPSLHSKPVTTSSLSGYVSKSSISIRRRSMCLAETPPARTSFRNVGNSCYMGATLRALMSVRSFVTDLGHKRIMDLPNLPEDSFYKAFLSLTDVVTDEKRKEVIDPTPVKTKLGRHFRMFLGAQQQDSHEFFMDCLLQLETDLFPHLRLLRAQDVVNKVRAAQRKIQNAIKASGSSGKSQAKKVAAKRRGRHINEDSDSNASQKESDTSVSSSATPVEDEDADLWEKFANDGDMLQFQTMFCPSRRNFGGVLENTITCRDCKHSRAKNEAFKCLSVEVADKDTLESMLDSMKDVTTDPDEKSRLEQAKPKDKYPTVGNLLDLFFAQELVEARCEKCECKEAILVRRILRPPRVLVIHLKRFSQTETGRGIKVHEEVEIDQVLELHKHAVSLESNVYQRPIPYDSSDFKDFEKNRKKRLETMKQKAASSKGAVGAGQTKITNFVSSSAQSSTSSPNKASSTSKLTDAAASMESAPKRRKLSDNDELLAEENDKASSDMWNFADQEQEATQPADVRVYDTPSKPQKQPSLNDLVRKSRVIVESAEPELYHAETRSPNTSIQENSKPATTLNLAYDVDDDDESLKRVIEESLKEAMNPKPQPTTDDEIDADFLKAIEASKKYAQPYDDVDLQGPPEEEVEDVSEEIVMFSSSKRDPKDMTVGELMIAKQQESEIVIQDEQTQPLDDIPVESAPTAPSSPRVFQEYEDYISTPHPGDVNIFPEMGRPDPFEDDELRHSPKLASKGPRQCNYNLLSIIHHIGSSSSHGHYVTDVYNAEEKVWTHHDDMRVETHRDPADTFLKRFEKRRGAYLLFYVNSTVNTSAKPK